MSISLGGDEKFRSEPNVVPLCDVLLVLLIIFMIVTPVMMKGVSLRLPEAVNTISMPESPEVVMSIQKDGTIYIKNDKVTMDNLQTKLEEAFLTVAEKKLYLRADSDIEYGKIVRLIDVIRESGIEVVGIITEKKAEKTT
ncbi:MAG: biopolymer transporter ExbD [Candidatus Aminicenantes bacterium]|nr:biopolymer transporter ExbD [Candidatus Aminicenantes bacterium]